MDEDGFANYNIERYTDDPNTIQRVKNIERMINEKAEEVQGIMRVLNRTSPIVVNNQNLPLARDMLDLTERGRLLVAQMKLLDDSAQDILRGLRLRPTGRGLKRKRRTN
jgi:hypothetical protein